MFDSTLHTRQVILVKNLATGRGLANGSRGVVVRFATSPSSGAKLPVVRFTSGLEEVIRYVRAPAAYLVYICLLYTSPSPRD